MRVYYYSLSATPNLIMANNSGQDNPSRLQVKVIHYCT